MTPKQKRFVEEYLVDLNATQAAIRAGYSERRASEIGYQLLHKTTVQAALSAAIVARSERTETTQDQVVDELRKIAFANGTRYAKVKDQAVILTDTDALTEDEKAAISSIEETKYGVKVSTCDKLRALELLGKHLGMFNDKAKVEVSGLDGRPLGLLDMSQLTDDELRALAAEEENNATAGEQ